MAQGRANRAHGLNAPRSLAVVEFLQDGTADWETIADALEPKWTTVDRVLNTADMKTKLGINIDAKTGGINFENGDATAGRKLLRQILGAMTTAEVDSRSLDKVADRQVFLQRFEQLSVKVAPAVPKVGGRGATKPIGQLVPPSGGKTVPAPKRPKMDTTARKTLAPRTGVRTFQVDGVRLNGLYGECRKLPVETNENAAALLLRVFIELSSEAYLDEKQVPIPSGLGKKGANKWDDIGISLAAKVQCVIDNLDLTKKAKTFQQARLAIDQQSHSISSINTLHGYFHNRQLRPDAKDLMKAWDNWEAYLVGLHAAR